MNVAHLRNHRPIVFGLLALVAALAGSGCSRPLKFADWIIEPPDGIPIQEYAPVPSDERDEGAVRLIEDLVIGGDMSDPDAALYSPSIVVATETGDIFVADPGSHRVQMFGPAGEHLRTLGREGQGPGEFAWIWGMVIAGDRLVVDDIRNNRLSLWTLEGEYVSVQNQSGSSLSRMQGLADGSVVAKQSRYSPEDEPLESIVRIPTDGAKARPLIEIDGVMGIVPERHWTVRDMVDAMFKVVAFPRITVAVGAGSLLYVSPLHEYQVLALHPDGTAQWGLRVASPKPPYSIPAKRLVLQQAQRGGEGSIDIDDVDWPSEYTALEYLRTDGARRLYVFPEYWFEGEEQPSQRPVDVFSTAGEFIAAGFVPQVWSYAAGDHVYSIREDETGERIVVRHRLVLSENR